jgi:hypothetical protein
MLMDMRMVVELSGIVVASTADPKKVNVLIPVLRRLLECARVVRVEGLLDQFVFLARHWVAW